MHLEPSDKNARRLFERGIEGPRDDAQPAAIPGGGGLRRVAPSSHHRAPSPAAPPTTSTYVTPSRSSTPPGGSLEFIGIGGHYFIGPADERWDLVSG